MFDIGWSEMLLLTALAIIVVGPKDLPKVMRSVAGFVRKIRNFSSGFMQGIDQMAREAELEELRKSARITPKSAEDIMKEAVDPDDELADAFSEPSGSGDSLMSHMAQDETSGHFEQQSAEASEASDTATAKPKPKNDHIQDEKHDG